MTMNPIKAFVWLKGMSSRKQARAKAASMLELKRAALAVLWDKGHSDQCFRLINRAADFGTEDYVLRNIMKHLPDYDAHDITRACREASYAKLPEDALLTHEFIHVYKKLEEAFFISSDLRANGVEECQKIMTYALTHMEDGPLIVTMIWDRGFTTLDAILEFIPIFKDNNALSDGLL